ncbi:sensor histidine kinase [Streptomyces geranii]|uniref:sensor histidine kinase n=1 Tax=Streptomyces geranii TaxID=2058923 RepID=UPI0018E58F7A|nr:histidine kinase [Streptomyces geranii]
MTSSTPRTPGPADHSPAGPGQPPPAGLESAWRLPVVGRMLRAQARVRRIDRRHRWLFDSLVLPVIVAVTLLDVLFGDDSGPFETSAAHAALPVGLLVVVTAVMVVPLWWRRRKPAVVFGVVAAFAVVPWALDLWLLAAACLLAALHNLALHGPLRMLGRATAVALVEMCLAVWFLLPTQQPWLGLLLLVSQVIAAVALGLALRIQRVYLAALKERSARLEIERDQRMQITAAAERSRVAREMHDIVGHNLSVIVGLADGAASLSAHQDDDTSEALRMIGDTGRQAMDELRRVLGVLGSRRQEEPPLGPQPGLGDLHTLLSRVRAAGVAVSYRTEGDLAPLGSGVQLTVYRIVQEALTNTLKHAGPGTKAETTVAAGPAGIRVRIADTGPPTGAPSARPGGDGSGHGLVGIHQRSAMYGGTVTAGPRTDRPGWLLDVTLDVPESEAPGESAALAPAPASASGGQPS